MKIRFVKMHGCGNDVVVVDARVGQRIDWAKAAGRLLDRRFGVGGDQLLVLEKSSKAEVRMKIFERTGQESEMCGNGIRCVARYLRETDGITSKRLGIETVQDIKEINYDSPERITVDMGRPRRDEKLWGRDLEVDGRTIRLYALSMDNPHAVIFVDRLDDLAWVSTVGPKLETNPLFPEKTNVEFVFLRNSAEIDVRVWERGAGETMACGTGACAAGVVTRMIKNGANPMTVHFRGGDLEVAWEEGRSVQMTGPAARVFEGEIEI